MATGAVVARILTQYSDKGSKAAAKDIAKMGKGFDNFAKKSKRAFGIATAAAALFAVKIGKDAVQAAMADQKSQALLANTLRNTTGATNGAIAGVESYVTSLQKQFNVVDDDLRPAMARLVGATGSISAAQTLMQTALDVSAKSGADLATATGAVIKATSGQFKALKNLVPELSNATIKSKNVAKAFEEVNKASAGAAATRANTLEYRLIGLNIAYGEILETLGYALLPVIEKFATTVSKKILPAIETWVALNKEKLAASFQVASDFAIKLLAVAISFGEWVSNNMGVIKTMAVLIASMWAVGRIAAFITAIKTVTAAMAVLRTTAAGAAVASAFATGGVSAVAGAAAVAGILAAVGIAALAPGSTSGGSGKGGVSKPGPAIPGISSSGASTNGLSTKLGFPSNFGAKPPVIIAPAAGDDFNTWLKKLNESLKTTTGTTKALISAKQKELNLKLKELGITTTSQQDAIDQMAIIKNLQKQSKISGSPTIALGGSGSLGYGNRGGIDVTVNAGAVIGSKDALVQVVQEGLATASRRNGGGLFNGRPLAMQAI